MLTKKQFVSLFEDSKLNLGATSDEILYLEQYFDRYKNPNSNTLGVKDLLDEFGMSDRMDLIKMELLDYCKDERV